MDSKFNPPKTQKEFEERANGVEILAAQAVINALKQRRMSATRPIDMEIEYYENVIAHRKGEKVQWPPRGTA